MKKISLFLFILIFLLSLSACFGSMMNQPSENTTSSENTMSSEIIPPNESAQSSVTISQEEMDLLSEHVSEIISQEELASSSMDISESAGYLPFEFATVDLYGNTVTEETLGERQIFLVHHWATWCGPCIRGMPDLAKIAQDYGDSVGFIGLVNDFESNVEGAIEILEYVEMPDWFIMIDAYETSAKDLFQLVQTGYVPATVLITADGSVTEPLTSGRYRESIDELLAEIQRQNP